MMYVFTYILDDKYECIVSGSLDLNINRKESVHTYTYNTRRSKNTKFKWKDSKSEVNIKIFFYNTPSMPPFFFIPHT